MAGEVIITLGPNSKGSRRLRAFGKALPAQLEKGFRVAGNIFERDMKLKLSGPGRSKRRGGGPRSGTSGRSFRGQSGQYPGVVTDSLRSSVGSKVTRGTRGPSLEVGPNARGGAEIIYAKFLEGGTRNMRPFPFVAPTFEHKHNEAFDAIQRAIVRPLDR